MLELIPLYVSVYMGFLWMLLLVAHGQRDPNAFYLNTHITQSFCGNAPATMAIQDVFNWANNSLLSNLFGQYPGKYLLQKWQSTGQGFAFITVVDVASYWPPRLIGRLSRLLSKEYRRNGFQRATKVHTSMLSEWKWKAIWWLSTRSHDFWPEAVYSASLFSCVLTFKGSRWTFLERSNSRTYRRDITISTRTGGLVRCSIRWFAKNSWYLFFFLYLTIICLTWIKELAFLLLIHLAIQSETFGKVSFPPFVIS